MKTRLAVAFALLTTLPALGADLALPGGARQLSDRQLPSDSYALPVAAFDGDEIPAQVFEGQVERLSWRLERPGVSSLQILAPLRDQLAASGYDIVFECRDVDCGGFDFRFGTDVIPAPDMHVNIRDFRFLAAVRQESEAISLIVSRLAGANFVQVIHVYPGGSDQGVTFTALPTTQSEASPETQSDPAVQTDPATAPKVQGDVGQTLQAAGHVVLRDLVFETGASRLGKGPFASLEKLATYLTENPSHRIALVGHTDSVGSLTSNISLSKRRAGSVRQRMVTKYQITLSRIEAEGMGYLAPVASNLTREGRDENRRVEAILLTTR